MSESKDKFFINMLDPVNFINKTSFHHVGLCTGTYLKQFTTRMCN